MAVMWWGRQFAAICSADQVELVPTLGMCVHMLCMAEPYTTLFGNYVCDSGYTQGSPPLSLRLSLPRALSILPQGPAVCILDIAALSLSLVISTALWRVFSPQVSETHYTESSLKTLHTT